VVPAKLQMAFGSIPYGRERRLALNSPREPVLRRRLWLAWAIPFVLMLPVRPVATSLPECLLSEIHEWSAEFKNQFGMSISQLDDNDLERKEYQWQQWNMGPWIYEVNVNIRVNRMRSCLSKPREPNNGNLRGCLERSVFLGYERKRKDWLCTTNNRVLSIVPRKHNLIFIEEIEMFTFIFSQMDSESPGNPEIPSQSDKDNDQSKKIVCLVIVGTSWNLSMNLKKLGNRISWQRIDHLQIYKYPMLTTCFINRIHIFHFLGPPEMEDVRTVCPGVPIPLSVILPSKVCSNSTHYSALVSTRTGTGYRAAHRRHCHWKS
jgi:hypothetical protein